MKSIKQTIKTTNKKVMNDSAKIRKERWLVLVLTLKNKTLQFQMYRLVGYNLLLQNRQLGGLPFHPSPNLYFVVFFFF